MNLISWLFTDPLTAGGGTTPETFHYLWPWIVFCSLGLIICFYYYIEGRKRFVKNKPVIKYMLDRYLGWFAVICVIGYPLIFCRQYLNEYFFAWRVWRYLWLASLLAWAIVWIVYLVRKYPRERADYLARQNRQQYIRPRKTSNKRKAASAR